MTTPTNSRVLFFLLRDRIRYSEFYCLCCPNKSFTYEICFADYPLDYSDYTTNDYEDWYRYFRTVIDLESTLNYFWFAHDKYKKLLEKEWATWDSDEKKVIYHDGLPSKEGWYTFIVSFETKIGERNTILLGQMKNGKVSLGDISISEPKIIAWGNLPQKYFPHLN